MPSLLHEAPLMLFEDDPHLLLELLSRSFDLQIPAFSEIRVTVADHNDVLVLEGHSDKVFVLDQPDPT